MASILSQTAPTAAPARSYAGPMVLMTTLFFLFGAVTNFNDVLMPYLKDVCQLEKFAYASLVQSAFFGAYFVMGLPAGYLLKKVGYQRGIVIGLLVMAGGALLFVPAANARLFWLFLVGLGALGTGMTLLQVAANPFVTVLGPAQRAASRVSIVGAANNLGGTLSPLIGGALLFGGSALAGRLAALPVADRLTAEAGLVKSPYLGLAAVLLALAGLFFLVRLPLIREPADELEAAESLVTGAAGESTQPRISARAVRTQAWHYPHLLLGVVAIFVYVGAEVGIGTFLIPFAQRLGLTTLTPFTTGLLELRNAVGRVFGLEPIATSGRFTKEIAVLLVSFYWLSSLIGRSIGIPILNKVRGHRALVAVCAAAVALLVASMLSGGELALWLVVLCGLCNSVMWPIIFPLAIDGLGQHTKQGSSLLIMAIVGGALVPPLMGYLADTAGGLRLAFAVPMLCYVYLLFYALHGHRVR